MMMSTMMIETDITIRSTANNGLRTEDDPARERLRCSREFMYHLHFGHCVVVAVVVEEEEVHTYVCRQNIIMHRRSCRCYVIVGYRSIPSSLLVRR